MIASNYIVAKDIASTNQTLLYHTLRTTLLSLPTDVYKKVFVNSDFSDNEVVNILYQNGFLIDDDFSEIDVIEQLREADSNSGKQTVTIFSTNNCNARCYYCFEEGINLQDMTLSTAEQIVKFISSYFPNEELQIQWFGGEPLMAMNIVRFITKQLLSKGYKLCTHITTNGSYVSKEIVDFFLSNYVSTSFQITIDDIGDRYASIKRYIDIPKEKAFERIINACKLILDNGIMLSIRINFLPNKFEEAKSIYQQLSQIFDDYKSSLLRIYLSPITLDEGRSTCENIVTSDCFIDLLRFQYNSQIGSCPSENPRMQLLQCFYLKPKASFCGATQKYNLVITAEGKIFKCHRFVRYSNDKYVVGDVWNGIDTTKEAYKAFTDLKIKDDACKKCRALPICQEGCYAIRTLYGKERICNLSAKLEEHLLMYWNARNNR